MSILHTSMFNNDHFKPGHVRSRSYNELISQFKTVISSTSPNVVPPSQGSDQFTKGGRDYVKKRSYSDLMNDTTSLGMSTVNLHKRSRTAPPSPPYEFHASTSFAPTAAKGGLAPIKASLHIKNHTVIRSRSLSPNKKFFPASNPISPSDSPTTSPVAQKSTTFEGDSTQKKDEEKEKKSQTVEDKSRSVQLPSISTVLQSAPITKVKLNPITPTVSLDYFDTYKPNDDNWRHELLDSITKTSRQFNISRYNYLNRVSSQSVTSQGKPSTASLTSTASSINSTSPTSLPSAYKISKPNFTSKISSKFTAAKGHSVHTKPKGRKAYSERKIRFPFESNYTYLNRTYLTDVQKYPEYLELAELLILLSQLDKHQYVYSPPQEEKPEPHYEEASALVVALQNSHESYSRSRPMVTAPCLPKVSSVIPSPPSIATSHHSTVSPILTAIPLPAHHQYIQQQHMQEHLHVMHQHRGFALVQGLGHTQNGYTAFLSGYEIPTTPQKQHRSAPLTPPSSKSKPRSELLKSPSKSSQQHNTRVCISCGSDQSPCWRPSWSIKEGQLCNSCGLRYKKTAARCLNKDCKKIPAKGEWSLMQSKGKSVFEDGHEGFSCLDCSWRVEVKKC